MSATKKITKKQEELLGFLTILDILGFDVIAITGDSVNKKITIKEKGECE